MVILTGCLLYIVTVMVLVHFGLLPVSHSVCNAPKPMLMFLSALHMKQVEVGLEMKQWPKSSKLPKYQFILLFLWM